MTHPKEGTKEEQRQKKYDTNENKYWDDRLWILSVITLSIKRLNIPTTRQILLDWIKKDSAIFFLRHKL